MGKKKPAWMKKGAIRWESQIMGRGRGYQLQEVTSKYGGIRTLSQRMPKKEAKAFARGYNLAKGRRGRKIPVP